MVRFALAEPLSLFEYRFSIQRVVILSGVCPARSAGHA